MPEITKCNQCGDCCKVLFFRIPITNPMSKEYYKARGYKINNNRIVVKVNSICPNLTSRNKCRIHRNKPQSCKQFPDKDKPQKFIPDNCAFKKTNR